MDEQKLGKYEIRGTLGRGAMGTVYEGWDPIISRRVAIKTVRLPDTSDLEAQEELARFKREAQAAGRLSHPNIVGVFDYGETADLAYIVMEFIDGQSLKSLLDRQERFAVPEIVRVMEQLLAGLQYSHERGVVHRDIKPANVILTSGGQVKIADFGIARIESSSMTQAGTVLGTPAYMSPEQFMGQTVDSRTDIYSAGVMLYQLLTGERPFEGSMSAIMHKALNTEPPRPSELSVTAPRGFDAVVARAMAIRPEDRYGTAEAFAEAVRAATSQAQPLIAVGDDSETTMVAPARRPQPPSPAPPPPPPPRRSLPLMAGLAVVVLLVLGGIAWFWLQPSPAPEQQAAVTPVTPAPAPVTPAPAPAPSSAPPPAPPAAPTKTTTPVPAPLPAPATPAPSPVPAPAPAVTPPAPVQPSLASLRSAVRGVACTFANVQLPAPSRVLLDGISGAPEAVLRGAVASVAPAAELTWKVRNFTGPYCGVTDVLRGLDEDDRGVLGMALRGNPTRLHKDEHIVLQFTMPDFQAHLTVDYFASDGSLTHLVFDDGSKVRFMTGVGWKILGPSHLYGAGARVNIGEPDAKAAVDGWAVDEPFGTDMILAIASSLPLFPAARPADDKPTDYLRDLQAAIDASRAKGARIAGQALLVETSLH